MSSVASNVFLNKVSPIVNNEFYSETINSPIYCAFIVNYQQKLLFRISSSATRHCVDVTCLLVPFSYKDADIYGNNGNARNLSKGEIVEVFTIQSVGVCDYASFALAMLPDRFAVYGINISHFPILASDLHSQNLYVNNRTEFMERAHGCLFLDYSTHLLEQDRNSASSRFQNLGPYLNRRLLNQPCNINNILPNFDEQLYQYMLAASDWGFACTFAEFFRGVPVFPLFSYGLKKRYAVSKVENDNVANIKQIKRENGFNSIYVVGGAVQFDGNRLGCHCAISSILNVEEYFANDDILKKCYVIYSTSNANLPVDPVKKTIATNILSNARVESRKKVLDHYNDAARKNLAGKPSEKLYKEHVEDCSGIMRTGLRNMLRIKICHDANCVHDAHTPCYGFKLLVHQSIIGPDVEYATFGQFTDYSYHACDISDNYLARARFDFN